MIDLNGKIKDLNEAFNAFAGQGNINRKFSVGKVITMDGFYCLTASEGADDCIMNDQGKVLLGRLIIFKNSIANRMVSVNVFDYVH